MSTTIHISGLNVTACILNPLSFVLPLPGLHVRFIIILLAKLWISRIYTYWVTSSNFNEQQIRAQAKCHDRASLNILLSVPGIGDIFSLIILYEVHDIKRFESHQKFCSYCRLVKCERSSAGKHTKGGNQKIGNPYLKWAIADIIIHASHKSQLISDYYQKLQSRFGKRKAKSVISHKFGIAIYYMLKNKQVFDEQRFVQSNMK